MYMFDWRRDKHHHLSRMHRVVVVAYTQKSSTAILLWIFCVFCFCIAYELSMYNKTRYIEKYTYARPHTVAAAEGILFRCHFRNFRCARAHFYCLFINKKKKEIALIRCYGFFFFLHT